MKRITNILKEMNKKWLIVAAMVTFDGISCHYPAIFFGVSIREPNPVTSYLLNQFGASSIFILILLAILFIWLIVKLASKFVVKYEKTHKTLKEAENNLLNYVIVAYSVIIALGILMLAGRFFEFPSRLLPFYYNNRWLRKVNDSIIGYLIVAGLIILAVVIYSACKKLRQKKGK